MPCDKAIKGWENMQQKTCFVVIQKKNYILFCKDGNTLVVDWQHFGAAFPRWQDRRGMTHKDAPLRNTACSKTSQERFIQTKFLSRTKDGMTEERNAWTFFSWQSHFCCFRCCTVKKGGGGWISKPKSLDKDSFVRPISVTHKKLHLMTFSLVFF